MKNKGLIRSAACVMQGLMVTKESVRSQCLAARNALSPEEIVRRSRRIEDRLVALPWYRQARVIAFYVSIKNEVDTHAMIERSLEEGKTVAVPRTLPDGCLRLASIQSFGDLTAGRFGILEPREEGSQEVEPSRVQLFILPGIAFDKCGNRVGHGMGCYDKLLSSCVMTPKVGLAFACQVLDCVPFEPHDVGLSALITEDAVLLFH